MHRSDVRFDEPSNSELPAGWRRPSDLTEAFLVVAAMEMEARRRINYASPFDEAVYPLLADTFRYDPFAALLNFGGLQEAQTSTPTSSGGAGPLEAMSAMAHGERLSRLPLLQLIWQYVDLVRAQFGCLDFPTVLQRLDGVILGKEGTILFATGLDRQMHRGAELAPVEVSFIQGQPISMPDYLHRLVSPASRSVPIPPNGGLRANDIWNVCFRIIERTSPSSVLDAYAGRVEAVAAILDRGATLGQAGAKNLWPGWPTDVPVLSETTESADLDAEDGASGPAAGYTPDVAASADQVEDIVDWSSSVKTVAAGHSHSLTLRNDGTVAAFGKNDEGQCDVPETAHGAVAVACGGFHSLALMPGGGVVAWGANLHRQAEPPPGLKGVTAIAGGHQHSLALLSDGTVIQWGKVPGYQQVPVDLRDVVAISAGYEHSMALTKHGQVVVWGSNDKGQLDVPAGLSDVESISAGGWQCFALRSDGSVAAWGEGGDGATAVPSGPMYSAIAGGYWHAIALGSDGVVTWGDNEYGQTRVPPLARLSRDVAAIAAGGEYNIALRNDGSIIGWGRSDSGQIAFYRPISFSQPPEQDGSHEPGHVVVGQAHTVYGWGSTDDRLLGYDPELNTEQPGCVEGLAGVADVSVIGGTVYAVLQDGAVWGWGANGSGQLNDGTKLDRYRPVQIPALIGVARIEAGPIATRLDGTTWTWSEEARDNPRPFPDPQIKNVKQIVHLGNWMSGRLAPGDAFHAVRADGTVVAWGRNDSGQLGNGSKNRAGELVSQPAPVMVSGTRRSILGKTTEVMEPLSNVVRLIRAGESVFALAADGSVWAWGANRHGQLADGSRDDRLAPVRLDFASDVVQLCTHRLTHQGFPWVYALTREGDVWKWRPEQGENAVPVRIPELSEIVEMSIEEGCAVALRNDRTVMAWHPNGSFTPPPPAQVEGLNNVVAIIAGERSAALLADGTVATWFGRGDSSPDIPGSWRPGKYTAIPAQGLTGIRKVATGGGTIAALRDDGTVWAWGVGNRGQLGNGDDRHRLVPAPIETVGTARSIHGGENTVVASRQDGSLTAWGDNAMGLNRLALSNDELRSGSPWDNALGLSGVTSVAVGWGSVVALRSDGTVWATGGGNGTERTYETRPERVRQLAGITAVASAHHTKYALDESGTVWAWGDAGRNQIGDGFILIPGPSMAGMVTSREVPVRSLIPGRVVAIAASYETAYALHEDGTVWAWGNNEHGELGNGRQQDMTQLMYERGAHVPRPACVSGLKNIRLIASGGSTAYAVATDGIVWGWGSNDHGQLGVGVNSELATLPVEIEGLPPIVGLSTSGYSTFATDAEGVVWAWGLNRDGQLGDGTQIDRRQPTRIPELRGAESVICVGKASFALVQAA